MQNATGSQGVVRILGGRPDSSPLYAWVDELDHPWEAVERYDAEWLPPEDTVLLVTHRHYSPIELSVLGNVLEANRVPVLILADGILEWRNTWNNPNVTPSSFFQPVVGHKMACIGSAQARVIRYWGNHGKCEVIGLPRLDAFAQNLVNRITREEGKSLPPVAASKPSVRVLVMTARTPGFTPSQLDTTYRALADLKLGFESVSKNGGPAFEPTWRLTGTMAEQLGVANQLVQMDEGHELQTQLAGVDAVISTPSTAVLEAAMHGVPVAVLDYHGTPNYLNPAWSIRHKDDVAAVLHDLANPPADRMVFQSQTLFDQLECHTPATPRMLQLASGMIDYGRQCRDADEPLAFPEFMISSEGLKGGGDRSISTARVAVDDTWMNEHQRESRLNQLAMVQYQALSSELQDLRELNGKLQVETQTQGRKIDRLEQKRLEQKGRIEKLKGRVRELRDRVGRLRENNQTLLEAWELKRKRLAEIERGSGDGHRVSEKDVSRIDPSGDPTDPNNPEDAGENL